MQYNNSINGDAAVPVDDDPAHAEQFRAAERNNL